MADQNNPDSPDRSQETTEGNEDQARDGRNNQVDKNHKPADKPIQPNPDVDDAQDPIST